MSNPILPKPVSRSQLTLRQEDLAQAAVARFEDHVANLRAMTGIDLQVFGGYLAIQLGFGAWLTDHTAKLITSDRAALSLLDTIIAFVAWYMLSLSARRRKEVIASLKHVKEALRFDEDNFYLKDAPLDATSNFRPWQPIYTATIPLSWCGIAAVLWGGLVISHCLP